MNCWFCKGELRWESDFSFEDYCLDGEGIVTNLTCTGCGAYFEGYLNLNQEEE